MKIQHIIPILLLAGFCTVSAQTNNTPAEPISIKLDNNGIPIGTLGFPIGSYLTIEGVKAKQNPMIMANQDLCLVETVNGIKLAKPVTIEIEKAKGWSNNVPFVFKGYETFGMVGTPPAEEAAAKEAGRKDFMPMQVVWHLSFYFVVTSVEAPKN